MKIALFVPCYVDQFMPDIARDALVVLEAYGAAVSFPASQTCCGQPPFNAGYWDPARRAAEHFEHVFASFDAIVCPSGSCTSMVRNHYSQLGDAYPAAQRTYELCEFLVTQLAITQISSTFSGRAAVHLGCHLRNELRAGDQMMTLLRSIDTLELADTKMDAWCCGFGGTFSVKFPELSTVMGEQRLQVGDDRIDCLISSDASCMMQLKSIVSRREYGPQILHVAQVLAEGLR